MTVTGKMALLVLAAAGGLGLFVGLAQSPALENVRPVERDQNRAVVEVEIDEAE